MTETDPPAGDETAADTSEAQRAADGLKGQIAALRDKVRQARADLLASRKREPRSFKD